MRQLWPRLRNRSGRHRTPGSLGEGAESSTTFAVSTGPTVSCLRLRTDDNLYTAPGCFTGLLRIHPAPGRRAVPNDLAVASQTAA